MASRTGWTGRVLVGAVAAMVLIALAAVPSFGATKKFALDIKPNTAFAGVSTDYTITIKNTTPGNSTINSFLVNVPFDLQSGTSVTAAPKPLPDSDNTNAQATVTPVGSQVRVQNIDSLKTGQIIKIRITATAADPTPGTCSTTPKTWTATVYAGNSLSGDQFAPAATTGFNSTVQLQSVSCIHLEFVNGRAPQDAIQGKVITSSDLDESGPSVQVQLVAGGSPVNVTTSGGAVSLSISSFDGSPVPPGTAPGVLTNFTSDFTNGLASFPGLKISNAANVPPTAGGDYQLKASYLSYPSIASGTFRIFDALICGSGSGEEVTYTEDSQVTTSGDITIQTNNDDCFAIIVDNNDLRGTGTGNIEEWSITKSTTTLMRGTLTTDWDLGDATAPVKWTQVTWDALGGVYHDVQLCIPGVPFDDQFPPAPPGSNYDTEEMCLVSSQLVAVGDHYVQHEVVAYKTDLGKRK